MQARKEKVEWQSPMSTSLSTALAIDQRDFCSLFTLIRCDDPLPGTETRGGSGLFGSQQLQQPANDREADNG